MEVYVNESDASQNQATRLADSGASGHYAPQSPSHTLQTVMGWTNAHLHPFVLPGTRNFGLRQLFGGKVGNENRMTLGALLDFPGAKLLYRYDFGDCWQHELVLEQVLPGDDWFRQLCVAGARQCAPEDSGGPAGFAELLKAFQEKDHPEHDYAREGFGDDFASASFSPDEINLGDLEPDRNVAPLPPRRKARSRSKNEQEIKATRHA